MTGSVPSGQNASQLLTFYQTHLVHHLLPFWKRAVDEERGGVYTCFNNMGTELVSKDKYTWSQGRFIWLWSRLAAMCQNGLLSDDGAVFLRQAKQAVDFIKEHAFLESGHCAFLLTEAGEKKEAIPGEGFDTSFYADCFVVVGFSEYARVARDRDILEQAIALHENIEERLMAGRVRSEPYPIPEGHKAHGIPMIMLNTTQELAGTLETFQDERSAVMREKSVRYMRQIMAQFYSSDGKVAEIILADGSLPASVLGRHLNPGHTLESMWFVMTEAQKIGRSDWIAQAAKAVKKAFSLGWDEAFGGLFRYVDREGGQPKGEESGGAFEQLVSDTWDMKIWWPHSEGLYATLLAYTFTQDEQFLSLYDQLHAYVFRTFPHPDNQVGEWIQIRDRRGEPVQKVVALPVKDPYHIIRNVILIIELLHNEVVADAL